MEANFQSSLEDEDEEDIDGELYEENICQYVTDNNENKADIN